MGDLSWGSHGRRLPEQERHIIDLRFSSRGKTQTEVAEESTSARPRSSRLEKT